LKPPPVTRCPWVPVIDEENSVADENLVFDVDPGADEAVRGYLATLTDPDVLLDLDERPDAGVVADSAAIKIHEIGMRDHHACGQHDIGCNRHRGLVLSPRWARPRVLPGRRCQNVYPMRAP
jgi:hypothetical protein